MMENIIVTLIVLAVTVFIGVRFYKTLSGKSGCGCCGSEKGRVCCGCQSVAKEAKTPGVLK